MPHLCSPLKYLSLSTHVLQNERTGKLEFNVHNKHRAVYTSEESKIAVQHGDQITKAYKAILFERDNTIFKSYVANLLQKKVECSGAELFGDDLDDFIEEHRLRFGLIYNEKGRRHKKVRVCVP